MPTVFTETTAYDPAFTPLCVHCRTPVKLGPFGAPVHVAGSEWCDPKNAPEREGYHAGGMFLLRDGEPGFPILCSADLPAAQLRALEAK